MALRNLCTSRAFVFARLLTTPHQSSLRFYKGPEVKKSIYKTEESKKLGFFVIHKYLQYVKNYDKILEKRFPKAMVVYKVFMLGIKDFYSDVKEFVKIIKIINGPGNSINTLTRRELEHYNKMPQDMMKIAPVLIISALPLANYVIFPLAFMFPKHLLTSHFWNKEQREEFKLHYLRKKLNLYRPLYKDLKNQIANIHQPGNKQITFMNILEKIKHRQRIKPNEIVECKQLFAQKPFHLIYISRRHVRHLIKFHGLHIGLFRRVRLGDHAIILKAMDRAILKEGGVHNMPKEALRNACYIRGLNANGMSDEELIEWLKNWMIISSAVDETNLSLLLHAPIFLGHNERTNVELLESGIKKPPVKLHEQK